jgi:hypothetical protein
MKKCPPFFPVEIPNCDNIHQFHVAIDGLFLTHSPQQARNPTLRWQLIISIGRMGLCQQEISNREEGMHVWPIRLLTDVTSFGGILSANGQTDMTRRAFMALSEVLLAAANPALPGFEEATLMLVSRIQSPNPQFVMELLTLLAIFSGTTDTKITAFAILRHFVRLHSSSSLPQRLRFEIVDFCWNCFASFQPAMRRQAIATLSLIMIQKPTDNAVFELLDQKLLGLLEPSSVPWTLLESMLEVASNIFQVFRFPPESGDQIARSVFRLLENPPHESLYECIFHFLTTIASQVDELFGDSDFTEASLKRVYHLYDQWALKIPILKFFCALADDFLGRQSESLLSLTLPDLIAFHSEFVLSKGSVMNGDLRNVTLQILVFWKAFLLTADALTIADDLLPVLFDIIHDIPDPVEQEWEPFSAAQSCLRALLLRDGMTTVPLLFQYIQETVNHDDPAIRESAMACVRICINDSSRELLDQLGGVFMAWVGQTLRDSASRVQRLALESLGIAFHQFGLSVILPYTEFLFSLVTASEPCAEWAFRILRLMSCDQSFRESEAFCSNLEMVIGVAHPLPVFPVVLECCEFAAVHNEFAPYVTEWIVQLLEMSDGCTEQAVSAACYVLAKIFSVRNDLTIAYFDRVRPLATASACQFGTGRDLVLLSLLASARSDDFEPYLDQLLHLIRDIAEKKQMDSSVLQATISSIYVLMQFSDNQETLEHLLSSLCFILKRARDVRVKSSCFTALNEPRKVPIGYMNAILRYAVIVVQLLSEIGDNDECVDYVAELAELFFRFSEEKEIATQIARWYALFMEQLGQNMPLLEILHNRGLARINTSMKLLVERMVLAVPETEQILIHPLILDALTPVVNPV